MAMVVGYIRVSTEQQADEGVSLDVQEVRIRGYCVAMGHSCVAIHRDEGISGKSMDNRPGLASALNDVCRQRAVLVVQSLSRLSRSVRHTLTISERLDKAGANLASLSESIDTTSASGRMVFKMLAVLAEFERELLSERTSSAMRQMAKRGERVGRYAQFGYRLSPDGAMRVCPEEQNVIAMIRRLAAVNLDAAAIACQLNSIGVACRSRLWRAQAVAKVLGRG